MQDYIYSSMYVVLLTVNVFNGCVFHFDEQGRYVAGGIRMLIFYPLAAIYVLTGLFLLARVLGRRDFARRRDMVSFLFCLTMAVAIAFQIAWPLWPFYALGCLVGNCFFHVFVVEDERAELRQAVVEREQAAKHAAELEKALERARAAEKARSMFFSIVSHDIRTPLNAILGYSEFLQLGVESESERSEALKSIRTSGTGDGRRDGNQVRPRQGHDDLDRRSGREGGRRRRDGRRGRGERRRLDGILLKPANLEALRKLLP